MPSLNLSGYKLTFDDEFNSLSVSQTGAGTTYADTRAEWRINGGTADIGFGSTSFVDPASGYNPFSVQNGALTITAIPKQASSATPGAWQSGLITTQGNFSQTYGYFEIRADFSNDPNAWDAFWLLPNKQSSAANTDASHQELDIVEHYGNNDAGVYSTIHTTDPQPAGVRWQDNRQVYSELSQPSGYHTYGMNWQADRITYYVDGQEVGSQATPSDLNTPMYILANLAVQSNAPTTGNPMTSKIDYIRVYSNDQRAVAVAQGAVSSPDGSDPGLYGATAAGTGPATAPAPVVTTVGSGADKLVLSISEDAYQGDAQFTVSVDGKQIGGTLTAHAAHGAAGYTKAGSSAQNDLITVLGDFGPGAHTVSVNFLNDAYGSPVGSGTDRNLYVDSASFNGTVVANSALSLLSSGSKSFSIPATGTSSTGTTTSPATGGTTSSALTVGSGADKLVLSISEDAYQGDAQFTVSVDGKQIGGTLTAHAAHGAAGYTKAGSAAQNDLITVLGDFGPGAHTVSVNFLNDAYGSPVGSGTDRNLYVDSASFNGVAVANSALGLLSSGSKSFSIPATGTSSTGPSTSTGGTTSSALTVGSGADKLVLSISEDAYQGDAQFTVSVDGKQIGGTLTAHAAHGAAGYTKAGSATQNDLITVLGDFGPGAHTVSVNFLNDAYGSPVGSGTDRNLYVDSASFNGAAVANSALSLLSSGSQSFSIPATGTSSTGPSTSTGGTTSSALTVGSGADKLVLSISEDAYQGDAQFTVSVDGKQIGGTLTAHAAHGAAGYTKAGSATQNDLITVLGDFGPGAHTVSVNFLNDAYGSPVGSGTDRNLYVDSASFNGTAVANSALSLLSSGSQSFTIPGTAASSTGTGGNASSPMSVGSGADTLMLAISEDAFQGDAQFTVSVDGHQIGGILTAHAAHGAAGYTKAGSSAQDDWFKVLGDFGPGAHTVSVNFLNDAYTSPVGSGTDRNLYVDSASFNGVAVANSSLSLLSSGSQSFTIPAAGTSNAGPNTFVFSSHFGNQSVQNFNVNSDTLQFDHTTFASFADVQAHAQQVGASTVITDAVGDTLTLTGVALANLHASDFHFV